MVQRQRLETVLPRSAQSRLSIWQAGDELALAGLACIMSCAAASRLTAKPKQRRTMKLESGHLQLRVTVPAISACL